MTERQGQAGDAFTGHSACPFFIVRPTAYKRSAVCNPRRIDTGQI